MTTILLINGPNLNTLGERQPEVYGNLTLKDVEERVSKRAGELGAEIKAFQSNHEGEIIDFIQAEARTADGMIVNLGAFSHYSWAIRDALEGALTPFVEVHISNIYRRERFRHRSVTAAIAVGMITGLGWRGYMAALEALVALNKESK